PDRVYHHFHGLRPPPISPPTFSLSEREFQEIFMGLKAHRGAYIINDLFPYFRQSEFPLIFSPCLSFLLGIYYQ
ncbi:hypothetical protein HMPREF0239_00001, partial [Clostridium sp. ATCC BAA-442]